MGKIVRKLRPTDTWRIGEHESWFRDMSLHGLHLKKMGTLFAQFEKGESKQIEYRIEVTNTKNISNEQIDIYEDNGWDYVTSYQYFHVFSSPKERNATELHTDPDEQSFTMEFNKNAISMIISTTLVIVLLLAVWLLDDTPMLRLIEGTSLYLFILVFFYLLQIYFFVRGILAIRALRNNLNEGKSINHHVPWEKSLRRNKAFFTIFMAIVMINTTLVIIQLTKIDTFSLPVGDSNLPFVRLAEIEQNPNLEPMEVVLIDEVLPTYYYHTNWSIFAPK